MHYIRVELRLVDGYYELHPAPEDEAVAELLLQKPKPPKQKSSFLPSRLKASPGCMNPLCFAKLARLL